MGPFDGNDSDVDDLYWKTRQEQYDQDRKELQIQEEESIFILLLMLCFGMMGTFVVRLLFF